VFLDAFHVQKVSRNCTDLQLAFVKEAGTNKYDNGESTRVKDLILGHEHAPNSCFLITPVKNLEAFLIIDFY